MAQSSSDFSSWITNIDLSSPESLENKVDTICEGIQDRLNPKNETEYIKVMRSHLLLEVWSQIRIFIMEQFQKNEFYNATIKGMNYNSNKPQSNQRRKRNRKQKPPSYKASLNVESMGNPIQIPHHSYLLLLWKSKSSFLDLNTISDALNQIESNNDNDNESKSNANNSNVTFPPHVMVQVDKIKMNKKHKQNPYQSVLDIKLKLNEKTFEVMREYKKLYEDNRDLLVIPIKNLIYLQRDYDAIKNVNNMPLSSFIMGREYLISHKITNTENLFKLIEHDGLIKKYFSKYLNKSQFLALKQSLIKPLTLIHGPPGTGKTKFALLPILKSAYFAINRDYSITSALRLYYSSIDG